MAAAVAAHTLRVAARSVSRVGAASAGAVANSVAVTSRPAGGSNPFARSGEGTGTLKRGPHATYAGIRSMTRTTAVHARWVDRGERIRRTRRKTATAPTSTVA